MIYKTSYLPSLDYLCKKIINNETISKLSDYRLSDYRLQ